MSLFTALFVKDLRYWFRRPGLHIFAGLFLLFGLLTMGSMAADWEFIQIGGAGGQAKADSPYMILTLGLVLNLFATMNLATTAGGAATRDVTEGMHSLVYTTPVPKGVLLGTRWLGAMAVSAYLYAAIPLGLVLGRMVIPGLEPERIGAFSVLPTLAGMVVWGTPNVLLTVSLFFAIGSVTRRMFPIYIGGVFLFVGYLGSSAFLSDLDDRTIGVLIDPFGTTALSELTRYWTPSEQNALVPWPTGLALVNRLLWTGIALVAGLLGAAGTRLDEFGWQPLARFQRRPSEAVESATPVDRVLPTPTRDFGTATRLRQLVALSRRAAGDVIGHRYFWAFIGAAVLFELLNAQAIGTMWGTDTWPTTYQVLTIFEGTLGIFMLVILTFYAGDLVWNERDIGQAQLLDSAPIPDWLPLIAKFLALTLVLIGLHTTVLVLGPLVQLFSGYTNLELGLYLQSLYGLSMLEWLPYVALALAVHAVVNNKVAGHVVLVAIYMGMVFRDSVGFEYNVPWFGSDPGRLYSDMNGWGFSLGPYVLYHLYWIVVGGALVVVARLGWLRGTDDGWRQRLAEARRRLDRPTAALLAGFGLTAACMATVIAYQTSVVWGYEHSVTDKRAQAAYERAMKAEWDGAPHPIITAVQARVDLYPTLGKAVTNGTFTLVNPHDVPITRMLVNFPDDDLVDAYTFGLPYTETIDDDMSVHTWTLSEPLQPGATTTLTWATRHGYDGLPNTGFETSVVGNGSFLHHNEVFPSFGYQLDYELSDPATRRTYDLPLRDRMRDLDDPVARTMNYLGDDAHRVDVDVTVSTDVGQIPLAPGRLVSQKTESGRVVAQFRSEQVWYFLAFLSADYTVTTREGGPVPLAVYSHTDHPYNVERMLDGMVASLEMFERDFGPYSYDHLNIVEFPRYASYAQAFPTMVPFSESIGFIARLDDPDEDVDYPFYVTAHEVAHQWWAHQLIAGDGQGCTVLSESLSQYSALKVMEAEYGKDHIRRFLEYESDQYFRGRANERDKELPLMRVENQPYIHYQKGGSILYALSERIGREAFDEAIRDFLRTHNRSEPPYANARDFVDHLKTRFADHEEALVDGFERIVLYDLRATKATATKQGTDWVISVEVTALKKVADASGEEVDEAFSDEVELLVETVDGEKQLLPVRVDGDGTVQVTVSGQPVRVVLDGRGLFLDRDRDDNEAKVEQTAL